MNPKRLKLSIEMTRRAGLYIRRPRGITRATSLGRVKTGWTGKVDLRTGKRRELKPANRTQRRLYETTQAKFKRWAA